MTSWCWFKKMCNSYLFVKTLKQHSEFLVLMFREKLANKKKFKCYLRK